MGNYIFLNRLNKKGDLGINKKVFVTIGEEAIKNINGVILKDKKDEKARPTVNVIVKANKISYRFNLLLEEDVSQEIVKEQVNKNLTLALINECDSLPFDVSFSFITLKK